MRRQGIFDRVAAQQPEETPEDVATLESGSRFESPLRVPRRKPRISLSDVALPEPKRRSILAELSSARSSQKILVDWGLGEVVEKGLGTGFLFYGPPGTGKTMAAEAIAGELNRRYVVLGTGEIESSVIGAVERRVSAAFEHARESGDVLVFDECDSLLYTREGLGKIQGAEANHLLRWVEDHDGVVVLTTNRLGIVDRALLRRIGCKLQFEPPDYDARVQIWARFLRSKLPVGQGVHELLLASLPLTGGQIKSIVVSAAKLTAHDGRRRVGLADLLCALNQELVSMADYQGELRQRTEPGQGAENEEKPEKRDQAQSGKREAF